MTPRAVLSLALFNGFRVLGNLAGMWFLSFFGSFYCLGFLFSWRCSPALTDPTVTWQRHSCLIPVFPLFCILWVGLLIVMDLFRKKTTKDTRAKIPKSCASLWRQWHSSRLTRRNLWKCRPEHDFITQRGWLKGAKTR
jgi:hypothetical protein